MHLFQDGFEHYNSFLQRYAAASSGSIATARNRTGLYGCTISSSGTVGLLRRIVAVAEENATFYQGVAFRRTAETGAGGLAFISDGGTATAHISVIVEADGSIKVRRGTNAGTVLATTAAALVPGDNAWHYLEARATLSDTVGVVDVYLDGVIVSALSVTATDTKNAGTKTVLDGHGLYGNSTFHLDDYYVCNAAGSVNNTFYGDTEVICGFPIADGVNVGFTPSTGTAHWSLVDETPGSATDYVSALTTGTKDSYDITALSNTSGTIRAVALHGLTKKIGTDAKFCAPLVRSAGTDYPGTGVVLATGDTYQTAIYETDPATSAAWTVANINAAEFGFVGKDTA